MFWDFSIGRSLGMVLRTLPYIVFRMLIYFGITLAYIVFTGGGAGLGYGIGMAGTDDFQAWSSVIGGIAGFGAVSIWAYWLREWLLYTVKTGHIACLVHLMDNKPIPGGQAQIAYGVGIVKERFAAMNALFLLDQLIKGVVGAITGLFNTIANWIPIPGLQGLVRIAGAILKMATSFIDEIIIAHAIRTNDPNTWNAARESTVLYAQNHKVILKNAVWLVLIVYILSFTFFLIALAPAAAIVYFLPGAGTGTMMSIIVAVLFAWSFKQALMEPFAIACLMQVYFKAIEGQRPDPAWDAKLMEMSGKFRDLKDKAMAYGSSVMASRLA